MTYFALERQPLGEHRWKAGNGSRSQQWTDLTFLNLQAPKDQEQVQYGMYERQISFVVCGSDNKRWAGYAFVDTAFDDKDPEDDSVSDDGIYPDPISLYGEVDTNLPIRHARQYFLLIVKLRMAQVRNHWRYLVRYVERRINQYVCPRIHILDSKAILLLII